MKKIAIISVATLILSSCGTTQGSSYSGISKNIAEIKSHELDASSVREISRILQCERRQTERIPWFTVGHSVSTDLEYGNFRFNFIDSSHNIGAKTALRGSVVLDTGGASLPVRIASIIHEWSRSVRIVPNRPQVSDYPFSYSDPNQLAQALAAHTDSDRVILAVERPLDDDVIAFYGAAGRLFFVYLDREAIYSPDGALIDGDTAKVRLLERLISGDTKTVEGSLKKDHFFGFNLDVSSEDEFGEVDIPARSNQANAGIYLLEEATANLIKENGHDAWFVQMNEVHRADAVVAGDVTGLVDARSGEIIRYKVSRSTAAQKLSSGAVAGTICDPINGARVSR